MYERLQPRTLLERLIQESDRTVEEHCADFLSKAVQLGERGATLSPRQLARWMAGQVDSARPASRRVAKALWGHGFKELLSASVSCSTRTNETPSEGSDRLAAVEVIPFPHQAPTASLDAPVSFREEIAMAGEEAARFVRRAGVSVSRELIDQFDSDVRKLAFEYLRRPPYAMFRPLAALRVEVFGMVERHPRPEFVGDLYRVAGRVSALLAHASSDLGNSDAADSHARTAWICADLAGDSRLRAYIRWIQSNAAYWRGDLASAADAARSGQEISSHPDDQLRLVSQEARAFAGLREHDSASRALAIAADLRSRTASEVDLSTGVFFFGAGKAAYYASEAHLLLGGEQNIVQAIRDAEDSILLLKSSHEYDQLVELTAAARLDLTAALLATQDLDGADQHLGEVLGLPSASRTVPVIGRVREIYGKLGESAFSGSLRATEIREQIALFQAYPATRELPRLDRGADDAR